MNTTSLRRYLVSISWCRPLTKEKKAYCLNWENDLSVGGDCQLRRFWTSTISSEMYDVRKPKKEPHVSVSAQIKAACKPCIEMEELPYPLLGRRAPKGRLHLYQALFVYRKHAS